MRLDLYQAETERIAVGIRNRIVHDYMNIDMAIIRSLVVADQYRFVVNYLRSPFAGSPNNQDS